jgi:hypothetical protein
LKNRSENLAGRGQILSILQVNSRSIDQKSGEIWTGQVDLQPISFKSDRLLGRHDRLRSTCHSNTPLPSSEINLKSGSSNTFNPVKMLQQSGWLRTDFSLFRCRVLAALEKPFNHSGQ